MSRPMNIHIPGVRNPSGTYTNGKMYLHPGVCPKFHGDFQNLSADCEDCWGTNRDTIPWPEIFPGLRKEWRARG